MIEKGRKKSLKMTETMIEIKAPTETHESHTGPRWNELNEASNTARSRSHFRQKYFKMLCHNLLYFFWQNAKQCTATVDSLIICLMQHNSKVTPSIHLISFRNEEKKEISDFRPRRDRFVGVFPIIAWHEPKNVLEKASKWHKALLSIGSTLILGLLTW